MRILLANDTGTASCKGVSDGHARLLGRAGHEVIGRLRVGAQRVYEGGSDAEAGRAVGRDPAVRAAVEACDAVVVNGEGTIHHSAGHGWLALLALGQSLGKATVLTNAVVQDAPGFDEVFRRLDDLCVRESRSAACLRARGFECRVSPDSYYAALFEHGEDPALSGRVVVTDRHFQREHDVGEALDAFVGARTNVALLPFDTGDRPPRPWHRVPAKLSAARAVVTARHHGVCATVLSGVPFVGLGGNTLKVEGQM